MGVLAARTGFGKTVVAASLIAQRKCSTLVIVNNRALAQQWQAQLAKFLTIADEPLVEYTRTGRKRKKNVIGSYYGNQKRLSQLVDVATIQTLSRLKNVAEFTQAYGMVIVDEVHHLAAVTFDEVVKQIAAKFIYVLSATPYRRDGWDPIIFMRAGQIVYKTAKIDEQQVLTTKRSLILRLTNWGMLNSDQFKDQTIHENYEAILADRDRNQLIAADIVANFKAGRHQLVLTRRLAQIELLRQCLPKTLAAKIFELSGHQKATQNRETIQKITDSTAPYIIFATSNYVGEGVDIQSIDTLLLAMPVSWKGNVEQYLGRLNRNLAHKTDLRVYDYVDLFVPMLARMYQKRLRTYRELDYQLVVDNPQQVVAIYRGQNGYQQLVQAIKAAKGQSMIGVVSLTQPILKFIQQLNPATITVVITANLQAAMPLRYQQLVKTGVRVQVGATVLNTIIIDEQTVWYDYEELLGKAHQGYALKFGSAALAAHFKKLFDPEAKLF